MKLHQTIFLILVLLLSTNGSAQVIDLGECDEELLSKSGFNDLKKAIGDARIVIIGEQVHGVGTDYENFAFLVELLHEEMGFNVLSQEYCFYSFGQLSAQPKGEESAQRYRQAMYWPQAKAIENNRLFNYIDAQKKAGSPLFMEGFDPRIMHRKSFKKFCDSLLNKTYPNLLEASSRDQFLKTLHNVVTYEYNDTLTNSEDKTTFLKNTDSIINKLSASSADPRLPQIFKSLKGFAQNAWNIPGLKLTDVDRFEFRDQLMAENIFWIAETMYPKEKIIIRMHNGHAAKNMGLLKGSIPDSLIKKSLNVGSRINKRYGDDCFYMATTYYAGTYCKWDFKPKTIPFPKTESLEAELHNKGYKYAFVNLEEKRTYSMFFNEFNTWIEDGEIKAPFGSLFDGVIFIDQVAAPKKIEAIEK